MISSYISSLIGSAPSGYEALEYVINGVVLIFLITMAYRFVHSLFGGWSK